MLDVMGQQLREGKLAQLLCEILRIEDGQIVLRVMNSEMELAVGYKRDEVLGGDVADSELVAFENETTAAPDPRCLCIVGCSANGECPVHGDRVRMCPME